jgi:DNA polymerase III subunit delta'
LGFDELLGNQRIRTILKNYLKNDIIPYSMIFTGPRSANMLNFAVAFAKGVNCVNPLPDGDFCGQCSNCKEIDKEIFLDLKILKPDGQFFKKEQIAFLIEDNFNKPVKGNRKFNILVDANQMNLHSANAFLKVLEEPAPSNVFILITENLNVLLPTIQSRCQILKFSPLSRSEIKTYLMKKRDFDEDNARLISYLGQSNMDSVMDVNFDEFMKQREVVFSILSALLMKQGIEGVLLDLYNRSRSREKFLDYFGRLVNLISLMLRDIMVLHIEREGSFVINIDYKEKLRQLSNYITVRQTLFLIRKMEFLLRDIKRNLNTKVLILKFMESYNKQEVENV